MEENIMLELAAIKAALGNLTAIVTSQQTRKDFYTVNEVADLLGKVPYTVRQWCLEGRINASKRACGRGKSQEWVVSHDELTRYQQHGLIRRTSP